MSSKKYLLGPESYREFPETGPSFEQLKMLPKHICLGSKSVNL